MAFRNVAQWSRPFVLAFSLVVGLVSGLVGFGTPLEHALSDARYALRQHDANGLVLIEIDARSIATIDRWPWPRANYAAVVDRLRGAGAESVAFDVDFSSPSNPADDKAFAEALARADGLVTLPTFRQATSYGRVGYVDSLPIPALRAHSLSATVSILPDPDGLVRDAPLGEVTAGVPRPSFAAMIAGRNGAAGTSFPIDFAINPQSLPRLSFADVRDGRFDPAAVRGKRVLIGATAVELGDRYATPRNGVIPGVVIQALAALTLERGVPIRAGWLIPVLLVTVLAWPMLAARSPLRLAAGSAGVGIALFAAATAASAGGWEFALAPGFFVLVSATGWGAAAQIRAWLKDRQAIDQATGLPNEQALCQYLLDQPTTAVGLLRVANYDQLAATLSGDDIGQLICRVRDRISVSAGGVTVYRIEDRGLAWAAEHKPDQLAVEHGRLRTVMLTPFEINGRQVDVAIASGMATPVSEDPEDTIANAMLAADLALAEGTGWHLYGSADALTASNELSLAGDLDDAIRTGNLFTVYQPKLDIASNQIVSVEALVRWRHDERGFVSPSDFIPSLERADRIDRLTFHVIARTIADLQGWRESGHALTAAINISAKLLESAPFIDQVETMLQQSGVDPSWLIFEVTESAVMRFPDDAVAALRRFKALGVAISMDDYGTGQSTLSYLKNLPLDELKIDRGFVEHAHKNRLDAIIVRSTIELAHELGLKVVAEGIESQACLDFLQSVGCNLAQGFHVSLPVAADLIPGLVTARQAKCGTPGQPETGPSLTAAVKPSRLAA